MPAKAATTMDINRAIKEQIKSGHNIIKIRDLSGQHAIAAGITRNVEIVVEGRAGNYFGAFNTGAILSLDAGGSTLAAGDYTGDMQNSGGILISGSVGEAAGCYMSGGIIIVRGDTGDMCGRGMSGGVIIITGDTGAMCAADMLGGDIIISGNAGSGLATDMKGGTVYISGDCESVGRDVVEVDMDNEDLRKLKTYFRHYKIKASAEDFRKYIPRRMIP